MADKRIIELEERLTISENDYFATDNTNGTCKVNAKILLDRFDDDEDAIATKAAKVDLTNISITGSTNNTGSTIASGTYFYKDGTLVKAIAAIANGATLTLNTNYEIVTAGGLNDLNNALSYKTLYSISNQPFQTALNAAMSYINDDNCLDIILHIVHSNNDHYLRLTHKTSTQYTFADIMANASSYIAYSANISTTPANTKMYVNASGSSSDLSSTITNLEVLYKGL